MNRVKLEMDAQAPTATVFNPDWVSSPGETIADLLEQRGWTRAELARRIGDPLKFVDQLVDGLVPLNQQTATRLERVIGGSTGFWLVREAHYRQRSVRLGTRGRAKSEDR